MKNISKIGFVSSRSAIKKTQICAKGPDPLRSHALVCSCDDDVFHGHPNVLFAMALVLIQKIQAEGGGNMTKNARLGLLGHRYVKIAMLLGVGVLASCASPSENQDTTYDLSGNWQAINTQLQGTEYVIRQEDNRVSASFVKEPICVQDKEFFRGEVIGDRVIGKQFFCINEKTLHARDLHIFIINNDKVMLPIQEGEDVVVERVD